MSKEQKDIVTEINVEETQNKQSFEANVETSFFYTLDKFINSLDNNVIFYDIQKKYENINLSNNDTAIKKSLALFLDDEKFVNSILKKYNITIFDLFKILYTKYNSLFKGPYIKKIKKIITDKKYENNGIRL